MKPVQVFNSLVEVDKTCQAVFSETKYAEGHQKSYTYMVPPGMELEVGDMAVVERSGKYSFVTIVEVHDKAMIDPKAPFRFKWLVDKVETQAYHDRVKAEDEIIANIESDMIATKRHAAAQKAEELISDGLQERIKKL